jgi:hypothetical protein
MRELPALIVESRPAVLPSNVLRSEPGCPPASLILLGNLHPMQRVICIAAACSNAPSGLLGRTRFWSRGWFEEGECKMTDRTPSICGAQNGFLLRPSYLRRAACAIIAVSVLATAHPVAAKRAADRDATWLQVERQTAPIVNGQRIQPTPDILPRPDLSERSARAVEELYRQLMSSSRVSEAPR